MGHWKGGKEEGFGYPPSINLRRPGKNARVSGKYLGLVLSGLPNGASLCESWCLHTSLEHEAKVVEEKTQRIWTGHALERCEDKT